MKTEETYYNEVFEDGGAVREPYGPLIATRKFLGQGMLAERRARANALLRRQGATFPLSDEPGEKDRVLPADWTPRIIPGDHWERLSAGLLQRGRAINAWLTDLYDGGGPGSQDVVPEEIVESSAFYRPRPLPDCSIPTPIHIYGPDAVHLGDGRYIVLEDNVRTPSGVAYSEAVRRAGQEVMREMFYSYRVSDLYAYYGMLRATLQAAAPEGVEDPFIAVVSGGSGDSAFFEHRRLAEACGVELLELDGLRIRNGEVVTESEGRRVDVIYRRFEEDLLKNDFPKLEDAYGAGKVNLVNAPWVGVADDKAVFPYVPAMIERYLEEEPVLEGAPTFSLSDPEQRAEALERLPELVLKPREGYGGKGVLVGPEASKEDLEDARRQVEENPENYIAQETLDFSTHVVGEPPEGSDEAFVDLRAFVLPAVGYVMPGGLTRVSQPETRVVNSSAGGSFKDTWVLEC